MGRIKTLPVKNITRKLVAEGKERFSSDFGKNKLALDGLIGTSKKIRNSIAGYIARLIRREKREK